MSVRMFAAVIQRKSEYLVCQRAPHQPHAGLWGFPTGIRQAQEVLPECVRREVESMLQVSVKNVGSQLYSTTDPQSGAVVDFVPVTIVGEPRCLTHAALRWIPLEDIPSLMLAPTDRSFAEFLESLSKSHHIGVRVRTH